MNDMSSARAPNDARAAVGYLRIEALDKHFGTFAALKNVSLTISQGEFVCFLGPSGCGKTTLLRCIAGLETPSAGRIEQAGKDITALPPAERDFGIVFQSYALFPNLTVRDNVGYGLASRRAPRADIDRKVGELLSLVGLPEQGIKYPAQLSGGQQQRVALARALATSPGLLLLDEPLSALDARVRSHLRGEIKTLQRRIGVTTVMVTHDQEEALTMADRIVVMNQGVIEQVGSPIEIYRAPASPFVAEFIGSMNFLDGRIAAPGQVRLGEASLVFEGPSPAVGSAVKVCLRPEDATVRNVGPQTANRVEVEIVEIEFLGAFCRAALRPTAAGMGAFHGDFSINLMRDLALAVGKRLIVALPPDRLRVFAVN